MCRVAAEMGKRGGGGEDPGGTWLLGEGALSARAAIVGSKVKVVLKRKKKDTLYVYKTISRQKLFAFIAMRGGGDIIDLCCNMSYSLLLREG